MTLTRRQTLVGGAAALVLPSSASVATTGDAVPILRAGPATLQLAPENYPATDVWAYDARIPGPVIRVRRGERLRRDFLNELPQPSTIHWHGIRLDNAMDGVPGLTQEAVAPGDRFSYDFVANDAGTYWYHPHVRSWEQVARGLYGVLIVDEADPPDVDREDILVLDDWRLTRDARIDETFGNMHDRSHAGRIGNWVTVNGLAEPRREAQRFERRRLRLVNAATARIFDLELRGLRGWVVAVDGQPVEAPRMTARLSLAPAQRSDLIVDVIADPGTEAQLLSVERDGSYVLAGFDVRDGGLVDRRDEPPLLEPNDVPDPDLASARRVELRMEGGAMGGLRGAEFGGQRLSMRELVGQGKAWALNGRADFPDEPLISARLGETVEVAIQNDNRWPHAMHLHGHHFRERLQSGSLGPLRDTQVLGPMEQRAIVFVADNPGRWLLHCHMLGHAAAGMSTWIEVI